MRRRGRRLRRHRTNRRRRRSRRGRSRLGSDRSRLGPRWRVRQRLRRHRPERRRLRCRDRRARGLRRRRIEGDRLPEVDSSPSDCRASRRRRRERPCGCLWACRRRRAHRRRRVRRYRDGLLQRTRRLCGADPRCRRCSSPHSAPRDRQPDEAACGSQREHGQDEDQQAVGHRMHPQRRKAPHDQRRGGIVAARAGRARRCDPAVSAPTGEERVPASPKTNAIAAARAIRTTAAAPQAPWASAAAPVDVGIRPTSRLEEAGLKNPNRPDPRRV